MLEKINFAWIICDKKWSSLSTRWWDEPKQTHLHETRLMISVSCSFKLEPLCTKQALGKKVAGLVPNLSLFWLEVKFWATRDNLVFIVAKSNTYRSVPVKYSSIGGPLLHAVCNTALRVSQEPKNLFSQPKTKPRCEHDPYLTYHLYRNRQSCQRRRYKSHRWGTERWHTRRCSCRSTTPRSQLCTRTWNRRNNWYTSRQTYTD